MMRNLEAPAEASVGAGQAPADLVYAKLSAGIGAGLVLAGEFCRGSAEGDTRLSLGAPRVYYGFDLAIWRGAKRCPPTL